MKKDPKIELTPYQQFIERLVHAMIILALLGIFLKILIF
jgi:hypothetical protein